jgi:hypothetical protein
MVYGVAMISYMCTAFKYLIATLDVAKVDTPGRIDEESVVILGYVMIALDSLVIVGALATVATMFVLFKKKLAIVNGKGQDGTGRGNVRVQPLGDQFVSPGIPDEEGIELPTTNTS